MKRTLPIVFLCWISLGISPAIFAGEPTANAEKSESGKLKSNNHSVQVEPAITNEAEYADYVKKREGTSSSKKGASSASSVTYMQSNNTSSKKATSAIK